MTHTAGRGRKRQSSNQNPDTNDKGIKKIKYKNKNKRKNKTKQNKTKTYWQEMYDVYSDPVFFPAGFFDRKGKRIAFESENHQDNTTYCTSQPTTTSLDIQGEQQQCWCNVA